MAITPQEFFKNNMKWISLLFFCLFMLKLVQSCNRNMGSRIIEKEYKHTIDSLTKKYDILEKESSVTIKQLQFELRLQSEMAGEANKRAAAVQSVAEKMRANTTVNIRGAQMDTIKRK
jgi:hypothetical protein